MGKPISAWMAACPCRSNPRGNSGLVPKCVFGRRVRNRNDVFALAIAGSLWCLDSLRKLRNYPLLYVECGIISFAHAVGPTHRAALPVLLVVSTRSSSGSLGDFGFTPWPDRPDALLHPNSSASRA